jgi:hypothetical protein
MAAKKSMWKQPSTPTQVEGGAGGKHTQEVKTFSRCSSARRNLLTLEERVGKFEYD